MFHVHSAVRWAALVVTLAAVSCSDAATLAKPDLTGAYNLVRVSGDAQQGAGGSQLPSQLVVRLLDRAGSGVAGLRVTFNVVSGGGAVAPASAATDGDGYARTIWTLGMSANQQRVEASVSGVAAVAFTADASGVTPEQVARAVAVMPAQYMFSSVGDTLHLTAVASDSAGRLLAGARVRWTALDPSVATVDSTGTVVSRANGNARITATVGSAAGATGVHVQQVVARVAMGATADTLNLVGDTLRLSAIPVDRRGNPVPQATQTWVSLDPTVATVDSAGLVVGTGVGNTTVRAVAGAQYGTASVNVRGRKNSSVARVTVAPSSTNIPGIGATSQLIAHAYDVNGVELSGVQFKWGSGDPSIASVDPSGKVTGKRAGSTQVLAVAGGVSGSAGVTVTVPVSSVAKVVVSPSAPVIDGLGNTVQLTATAYDGNNNAMTGQTFTWTSANGAVATVSANGLVTSTAVGTAQITATTAGVQGSVSVSVIQTSVAVARVAITPSSAQLTGIGSTTKLTAQAYDAAGSPVSTSISWSTANTAVATVDATGLVTARGAGTAQVTAISGTVQGSASVTVTVPVARVSVTPATSSLTSAGATVQLTAQAYDAAGNALSGQSYAWASSNTALATVSASGLVTAVSAGSVTMTATAGGVSGQASVSVVVATSVPSTGNPTPQAGDQVLFDFRSSLQQQTDEATALNLVSPERSGVWHFTTNFDGQGTKALRVDWLQAAGCVDDGRLMVIRYPNSSLPRRVYVQWKQRMGRTNTGGGIGNLDAFAVTNPACGNASRKEALMLRDVPDGGGYDRIEYIWPGPAPAYPALTQDMTSYRLDQNQGVLWEGQQHVAQVLTQTIYYQAESSAGAHDGVLRLWINGVLLMEDTHAAIGAEAFERWELPTTMRAPAQDQSEYFWDMVSWVPAQ